MRSVYPGFGMLLFGGLLLCGCAMGGAKRRAALEKQTARATNTGAGAANGAPVWQMRIGRVALVNSELDFVLIDAGTSPVPAPGTRLRAYSEEECSAELSVSVHQQRPFLIADILSGKPRVSDMVVPVKGDPKLGEDRPAPKTGREPEALPPAGTDSVRKERPGNPVMPPSRPMQAASGSPDTGELPQIERRPPPPVQSLLSPNRPAAEESEAIIPGLPSPGRNAPR
jgi:hypothetical protein